MAWHSRMLPKAISKRNLSRRLDLAEPSWRFKAALLAAPDLWHLGKGMA